MYSIQGYIELSQIISYFGHSFCRQMLRIQGRSMLHKSTILRVLLFKQLTTASATAVSPVKGIYSNERKAPTYGNTTSGNAINGELSGYSNSLNKSLGGKPLEGPTNTGDRSDDKGINWYVSWYGIGSKPFEANVQIELSKPLGTEDIEIKPDGLIYLPEIKYRRTLNRAFGAGGWGLVPRSETIVTSKLVTREYGLVCHGQLVSVARGEQDYFSETGIPTATEGCKSNALMRCCKDLGVGSELWDPVFIKKFKVTQCVEKFVEHITTKKKKKIWLRKDRQVEYPYK